METFIIIKPVLKNASVIFVRVNQCINLKYKFFESRNIIIYTLDDNG